MVEMSLLTLNMELKKKPFSYAIISSTVPAVAISFDDDNVRGMWRQRVTLPCKTVGIPEPTKKWMFG